MSTQVWERSQGAYDRKPGTQPASVINRLTRQLCFCTRFGSTGDGSLIVVNCMIPSMAKKCPFAAPAQASLES